MLKTFLLKQLEGMGFTGTITLWAVLLIAPVVLFFLGRESLLVASRSRHSQRDLWEGYMFMAGAFGMVAVAVAIFLTIGSELTHHTKETFGPFVSGLLMVTVVCIVLFPISFVGSRIRLFFSYTRKQARTEARKAATVVALGFAVIAAVGVLLHFVLPGKTEIFFWGMALLALLVGVLGGFFVPKL